MPSQLYTNRKGEVFEILYDECDRVIIEGHSWCVIKAPRHFYAMTNLPKPTGGQKMLQLHRAIMEPPDDMEVDHANGNGLDNRRGNLRVCTKIKNLQNQQLSRKNTSGFKGVYFHKGHSKWVARITVDTKDIYLGDFDNKEEAAKAYDDAALKHFGAYSKINLPKT